MKKFELNSSAIAFPCKSCGALLPIHLDSNQEICNHCQCRHPINETQISRVRVYLKTLQAIEKQASDALTEGMYHKKQRNFLRGILLSVGLTVVMALLGFCYSWLYSQMEKLYGTSVVRWVMYPIAGLGFLGLCFGWVYVLLKARRVPFQLPTPLITKAQCVECGAQFSIRLGESQITCPFCEAKLIPNETTTKQAERLAVSQIKPIQKQSEQEREKTALYYQRQGQVGRMFAIGWVTFCIGKLIGAGICIGLITGLKLSDKWTSFIMLADFLFWVLFAIWFARYWNRRILRKEAKIKALPIVEQTALHEKKERFSMLRNMFVIPAILLVAFLGAIFDILRNAHTESLWLHSLPEGSLSMKEGVPARWKGEILSEEIHKTPTGKPATIYFSWLSYRANKSYHEVCTQMKAEHTKLLTGEGILPIRFWEYPDKITVLDSKSGKLKSGFQHFPKVLLGSEYSSSTIPISIQTLCNNWMNQNPTYHEVSVSEGQSVEIMACLQNHELVPCPNQSAMVSIHSLFTIPQAEALDFTNIMRGVVIVFGIFLLCAGSASFTENVNKKFQSRNTVFAKEGV